MQNRILISSIVSYTCGYCQYFVPFKQHLKHLSCDSECCSSGKQDTPPSFSVVASISSEASASTRAASDDLAVTSLSASHRQTSAVTAASGGSSTSPVWNEWLACDFQQEHLATAVLQLNIMSGATSICRYTL